MLNKIKVLLIEDDKVIASLVKKFLDVRGYEIIHCDNGNTALATFNKYRFDICIIDVIIPYKDGYTVAQEIRDADPYVPILFVSSNTLPKDKIKAFKIGADDYLAKPLNVEELQLRIEAILKRKQNAPMGREADESQATELMIGKYHLDVPYQKLAINDDIRKLTSREAELLRFMYINRNDLIKREFILQEVWGDDDYYKGRSLDVFISRLRKYLKDDPNIEILNVHGIGFKFLVSDN